MLVESGHRLRVYVPYGKDWYAYSMRRLHENPKLAGYIAKGVFRPTARPMLKLAPPAGKASTAGDIRGGSAGAQSDAHNDGALDGPIHGPSLRKFPP